MKLTNKTISEPAFTIVSLLLIALAGFAVYINSIKGEFFWDDDFLIKNNTLIKSWSNLTYVFTNDMGMGSTAKYNFYRPLQTLIFMTEYSLWKLDVRGYHLTNIIFHILTALCIYWLTSILFKDKTVSFFSALLFAVHPVHTEAIACAAAIANPLSAFFILLCIIFYLKLQKKGTLINYTILLLSQISAVLTKETALILPLLILMYHCVFKQKIKFKYFMPIAGIAFIYLLLRLAVLAPASLPTPWLLPALMRIPGFFVAIVHYLKLLLLPINLYMDYGNLVFGISNPKVISGIIIVISLLLYAFLKRNSNQLVSFSILWFFIALLPFSNIYPLPFYMAEHYVYLPSVGFFIILAKLLNYYKIPQKLTKISLVFILIIYSLLTIKQNTYWTDPIAFYQRALRFNPDSEKLNNNLGKQYAAIGEYNTAIEFFKKVTEINPCLAEPYNNIGFMYYQQHKSRQAIEFYKKAIKTDPDCNTAYINLGMVYLFIGKIDKAISLYKKAMSVGPDNPSVYYNLAKAYYFKGKTEKALSLYQKTINLNPDFTPAHRDLAMIYYKQNLYDLAKKHVNIFIKLGGRVDAQILKSIEEKTVNKK